MHNFWRKILPLPLHYGADNFISRYEKRANPKFTLPQNVGAYAGRLNVLNGGWNYFGEFAYKINDPINSLQEDEMNYANGSAFTNSITYSQRGFKDAFEKHAANPKNSAHRE